MQDEPERPVVAVVEPLGRRRRVVRALGLALAVGAALLIISLAASLTIDLGPSLRARAESAGSSYLKRTLTIGRLSIRLFRGDFVVEDLVIGGPTDADRPFLEAGRIVVAMSWAPLLHREVFLESVEMTDWRIVIETFEGGRHTIPSFGSGEPGGPKRFVTTVQRIRATRGEVTYDDHGSPWSSVSRNLDITVIKSPGYRGQATFSDGTVKIRSFEPMRSAMESSFTIADGLMHFDRIDLHTDGAETVLVGDVDLNRWPEQTYEMTSRVEFPRMRELFFSGDDFSLSGAGDFEGTYHLFPGGYELTGRIRSDLAGLDAYRFPDLDGAVRWTPQRLDVKDASADFYGGSLSFSYAMAPLRGDTPTVATFDVAYDAVDLARFTDFLELDGIRLAGRATGRNLLEWPLGRFAEHRGDGHLQVQPPADARVMGAIDAASLLSEEETLGPEVGPFAPHPPLGHLSVGGDVAYTYGPAWVDFRDGRLATSKTYVEFEGRTAYGDESHIPFHVTSVDWQESDRVLAGIMTAFGFPTTAVQVGGHGEFDGVMTGAFRRPRIEGQFLGERLRAWDVTWGSIRADVVIENSYAVLTDARITQDDSTIELDGRFSLGFPRRDGGDEIDARVRLDGRPVVDLRHAFDQDEYPVTGTISGEFHLYGRYQEPFGFGRITIVDGVAYGEPVGPATAGMRFEGNGVRLDGIEIEKGGGLITGAALVGWDGTYTFNADGRRIPVETLAAVSYPRAPLSGQLEFAASGTGEFENPEYDVRGRVDDLFISDEGIGQVSGRIGLRGDVVTLEVEAASPRLAVSGAGRISRGPEADAELTFRFVDTSLDPYVRAFEPRLSPFTTAVASGAIRVVGELRHPEHLTVDGTIGQLDLSLFDYPIRNDEPIRLRLEGNVVRIDRMRLTGAGTALELSGDVDLDDRRVAIRADGDANLGILQGFFRDIRSSGDARVEARIIGSIEEPELTGSAVVTDGRIRYFELPHSLEAVNGTLDFAAGGITIGDMQARMGGGDVRLGGRIGLEGFGLGPLNLTATGEGLRLRFPEEVRSVVDADLAVRGRVESPVLTGQVDVRNAVWVKRFDATSDLFDLAGGEAAPASRLEDTASSFPLGLDVRIQALSTLRIDNSSARIVASADLTLQGSYDDPRLFGRVDIERGEVFFEGNRYLVTRGDIDFANPSKIEPFFDVEAETRVRVPGETYRVQFHVAGTPERFVPNLTSDPPLPTVDILSLLFGDPRDPRNAEVRSLRSPDVAEQELLQARAARLLASPISSGVGRVVEQTLGVDSVQITPSLSDPAAQQSSRFSPTARVTIGKRISDRVYLTYSRGFSSTTRDDVILLEYDQTNRTAWIVSQNEDRTYAVDFRLRRSF